MVCNLQLDSYSYYILPVTLIIFIYTWLEFIPGLISSKDLFKKSTWILSTKVFLVIFLSFYFIITALRYYNKQYQINYNFGPGNYLFKKDKLKHLTLIKAANNSRKSILIKNNSSYGLYIGTASVSSTAGRLLSPNQNIRLVTKGAIYGVNVSVVGDARYLEVV